MCMAPSLICNIPKSEVISLVSLIHEHQAQTWMHPGTREAAQQVPALVALVEYSALVHNAHMVVRATCNTVPRDPMPSSAACPLSLRAHHVHIYMQTNIYTYKIQTNTL